MNHTPGPWHYDDATATIDDELGVTVAGINPELSNYLTNAAAIAAAPALLALALDMVHWMRGEQLPGENPGLHLLWRIEDTIKRATGEKP